MIFYIGVLFGVLRDRIEYVRKADLDRGASALEWAIIAAIAVVIATVIGTVIYNFVQHQGDRLDKCQDTPAGQQCNN